MVLFLALAAVAASPSPPIQLVRLPEGKDITTLRSLADEAALAQEGAQAAAQAGMVSASESKALPGELAGAYRKLRAERGRFPTPVLSTLGGAAMLALGLGGIKPSPELVTRLASQGLGA